MLWIFILITTFALMLVKLGALSVMVTVLSAALCLSLVIIAGLVMSMLWRKAATAKKEKSVLSWIPHSGS